MMIMTHNLLPINYQYFPHGPAFAGLVWEMVSSMKGPGFMAPPLTQVELKTENYNAIILMMIISEKESLSSMAEYIN